MFEIYEKLDKPKFKTFEERCLAEYENLEDNYIRIKNAYDNLVTNTKIVDCKEAEKLVLISAPQFKYPLFTDWYSGEATNLVKKTLYQLEDILEWSDEETWNFLTQKKRCSFSTEPYLVNVIENKAITQFEYKPTDESQAVEKFYFIQLDNGEFTTAKIYDEPVFDSWVSYKFLDKLKLDCIEEFRSEIRNRIEELDSEED